MKAARLGGEVLQHAVFADAMLLAQLRGGGMRAFSAACLPRCSPSIQTAGMPRLALRGRGGVGWISMHRLMTAA